MIDKFKIFYRISVVISAISVFLFLFHLIVIHDMRSLDGKFLWICTAAIQPALSILMSVILRFVYKELESNKYKAWQEQADQKKETEESKID